MTRQQQRSHLIEFLRTIQRPDRPIEQIADDENLIQSGLADSLAVLQIVSYLEQTHGIDFSEQGIDTDELSSITGILDVIERNTS